MKKITLILFLFVFGVTSYAQSTINITTYGGNYTSEKWVSITTEIDGGGTQIWGQGDGTYGNSAGLINENIDIAPGTYYVNCYDRYSDGWDGTLISVTAYGTVIGDNGGVSPSNGSNDDTTSAFETPDVELEASFEIVVPEAPSSAPDCATNFVNNGDPNCGNEDFTVSWDAVTGATGYLITAGTTSGGNDLADALDQSGSSYTFTAVPGQSYYYTVTPYNGNGNAEGCEEQSVILSTAICTPCDSAIAVTPGIQQTGDTADFEDSIDDSTCLGSYDGGNDAIFSYVAVEDNETMTVTATLGSWSGVSMSLGCPTGDSTTYTCVGSVTGSGSGEKSFTSDFLIAGETYYIHISTWPAPQTTAFTLDTVVNAPAAVVPSCATNFTNTIDPGNLCGNEDFSVSWDAVDDVVGYLFTAGTTSGGNDVADAVDLGLSTSYSFTNVLAGQNYYYTVTPYNGAGNAEACEEQALSTGPDTCSPCDSAIALTPGIQQTGDTADFEDSIDDSTCLGSYDGGNDAIFSYVAVEDNETMTVTATLGSWSGVSMSLGCPTGDSTTYTCVGSVTGSGSGEKSFTSDPLIAGETYYIHISTWPLPQTTTFTLDTSVTTLGTDDYSQLNFTYYPNPVNDRLTINAQTNVDDITVLNMLGQVVLRQSPNSLNCMVDMATLRTGVYFVQVSIGNKTETVRVLKQ